MAFANAHLLHRLSEGIVVADYGGTILFMNRSAKKLLSVTAYQNRTLSALFGEMLPVQINSLIHYNL